MNGDDDDGINDDGDDELDVNESREHDHHHRHHNVNINHIEKAVNEAVPGDIPPLFIRLDSSFHRLLLHGICQYYGLISLSRSAGADVSPSISNPLHLGRLPSGIQNPNELDIRVTTVRFTSQTCRHPPPLSMSEYLKWRCSATLHHHHHVHHEAVPKPYAISVNDVI